LGAIVWDSVYRLEVQAVFSANKGRITVYNHGRRIWEKLNYASASSAPIKPIISYGIYGKPGVDMRLHVFKVSCDFPTNSQEPFQTTFLKIKEEEKV
jgi:hypothetical protein